MKKVILLLIFAQASLILYSQIIADHTIVDKFDDIPSEYIAKVKKMWVLIPGESHSWGSYFGLEDLSTVYPNYAISTSSSGAPPSYTGTALRFNKSTWGDYNSATGWIDEYGEEDWFTNSTAITRTKAGITYCNETYGLTISAMGFCWCWDAVSGNTTENADPVYGVHWNGVSIGSPEGNLPWGIDDGDNTITGNSINMDSYLEATQAYIDYCTAKGYSTKVFFTTGPVDYTGEKGYQGYLKYEHIRDYVDADATRILFDYADILAFDNDGTPATTTWNGHIYPVITATNSIPETTGHISSAGDLRLAKAIWWMMARIAGWNGN